MSQYDPSAEGRGTCPYCEKRTSVSKPDASGKRRCHRHKLPFRDQIGRPDKWCPGAGDVCLEDSRQ